MSRELTATSLFEIFGGATRDTHQPTTLISQGGWEGKQAEESQKMRTEQKQLRTPAVPTSERANHLSVQL